MDTITDFFTGKELTDWLSTSGLKIVAIVLITLLVERFGKMIVSRIVRKALNPDNYASQREEKLREDTLISIISAFVRIGIFVIAGMVILSELQIDIGPLLAGAGVVGFALGFGAQSLVKDLIAGMYIILENQYRVGDVVSLNSVGGSVVKITLRTTVLRDLDGNIHHIPNGTIDIATNKTMEYARINMNIGVSYEADIDKVRDVVNEVGQELSNDPEWRDTILEAPYFARINKFDDSAVVIKIFGKVQPAKQWAVAGEIRRRLKIAFDKKKISIPYPQVVVHQERK
jgi:small conductance mechanosensitive channel